MADLAHTLPTPKWFQLSLGARQLVALTAFTMALLVVGFSWSFVATDAPDTANLGLVTGAVILCVSSIVLGWIPGPKTPEESLNLIRRVIAYSAETHSRLMIFVAVLLSGAAVSVELGPKSVYHYRVTCGKAIGITMDDWRGAPRPFAACDNKTVLTVNLWIPLTSKPADWPIQCWFSDGKTRLVGETGCYNHLTCETGPTVPATGKALAQCPDDMIRVEGNGGPAFCLDRTEVLAENFAAFPDAQADTRKGCTRGETSLGQYPINCVSWYSARSYCQWLGRRLPTEQEWVRAAVGGRPKLKYPWSRREEDEPPNDTLCWNKPEPCSVANYTTFESSAPQRVSRLGFVDLAGNLWEWTDSTMEKDGERFACPARRIVRGGSFYNTSARQLDVNFRHYKEPGIENTNVGFRCAADLQPPIGTR